MSTFLLQNHFILEGFPTRLVIPATKFNTTFSKIGYIGIRIMLDKGKVPSLHKRTGFKL